MKRNISLIVMLVVVACAVACTRKEAQLTRVTVTGDADTQAPPDTAIVVLSVVTQNRAAFEAQQQNARKTEAVITAVKEAAGANAEVKTSSYSLQPERNYTGSRMPTIIGYEAKNTVTVTMRDLDNTGAVIDAASRAGANSVENVAFTLREGDAAQNQSLAEATRQAMGKAEGSAINNPPSAVDSYSMNSNTNTMMERQSTYATPVQAGSLNLRSQVQLIVEIGAKL